MLAVDRPRYNSLSAHLRARFGRRLAKIAIDAGLSCPNRDGTISRQGCLFCDGQGSGSGAARQGLSVTRQIEAAIPRLARRYKTDRFIAYFQAFTNTYAQVEDLARLYGQALAFEEVLVLAIGTRP
ncbi:MAG: TIGR01212 family radical SAM protein, partial [Deltaproteobacteria bacterium]|nr:TIGR01212 family radical SAM protein [Deltaproteobacteria bacterium]